MITRLSARFPVLTAAFFYAIAALLAFSQIFFGKVLLWPYSDQLNGYPPRLFAAEYLKEFGRIPEWSPYIFGGFPFAANTGFGDTFFPTALLRLIFPVDQGMALGFMVFVFLAGLFAFLFLRSLRLSWGAAFTGGAAYMFSGMVFSMASPGHDGKLFVSAMLPLALMFLYRAATLGDWRQYLYFGVTVGFCLLTPHFQATYYLLMASGFFWFFMIFLSGEKAESESWWRAGLLFGGALVVGFSMAAVQLLPFIEYLPFSARGADRDWAYAVSYSMPPEETIGAFLPGFNGSTMEGYFGRNIFKLHSEYLGVVAALLSLVSFRLTARKRTAWFFVFLALYAAIFGFGGFTPFYTIPFHVLPGIAKTRAPSIIFFLVSFCVAVLAAFGTEFLLSRGSEVAASAKGAAKKAVQETGSLLQQIDRRILYGLAAIALVAVLAVVGGLRPAMESIAHNTAGLPPGAEQQVVQRREVALDNNYPLFVRHMWIALMFAAGATALLVPSVSRKLGRETVGLMLGIIVLADLWAFENTYLRWTAPATELMRADDVVALIKADTTLNRVLPVEAPYDMNYLMAHRIRSVLGHNGFEIDAYDNLLGEKNKWLNLVSSQLWRLLGVKYVVIAGPSYCPEKPPAPQSPDVLAFCATVVPVKDGLHTYDGGVATVYRVADPLPYAFLVPVAYRVQADMASIIATVLKPGFDARGVAIIPKESPFGSDSISAAGVPITNSVSSHEERPGKLHFELERPAENDAFLYVAENYFPSWHATVDGAPVSVVRAQSSLMAVPIKAGAKKVDLEFTSDSYHRGLMISIITLAAVLIVALLAWIQSRRAAAPRLT